MEKVNVSFFEILFPQYRRLFFLTHYDKGDCTRFRKLFSCIM